MELWSRIVPLDAFNVIAHHCFKTPTHVEEILAQDKQLLVYRLVCKKWESFFNVFLQTRFDTINFESMEGLFVQNRYWDGTYFKKEYKKRLYYLKKVIIINNSQTFLGWIVDQKKKMQDYQITKQVQDSNNNYSVFDWNKIKETDFGLAPEISFYQLHSYLAHGGFMSRDLVGKLVWFLLKRLDNYIEYGQNIFISENFIWKDVFKYIYFNDEKFNKNLLNINFSFFLGTLLRFIHNIGNINDFNSKRYTNAELLSKRMFEDFKQLSFEVNYGEFLESADLRVFECRKNFIVIFFNKFRYYFSRNNFEGKYFLKILLQYRLKCFHNDYKRSDLLQRIRNTNRLILHFIREFKNEIQGVSSEQKKEYLTLFRTSKKADFFLFLLDISVKKNIKRENAIAELLDSIVLSVPLLLVSPINIIKKTVVDIQKSYGFNNNPKDPNQLIEQLDNVTSAAPENISSNEQSDSSEKLNNFERRTLENKKQNNQKPRNIILRKIVLGITFFICGFLCLRGLRAFYHKLII